MSVFEFEAAGFVVSMAERVEQSRLRLFVTSLATALVVLEQRWLALAKIAVCGCWPGHSDCSSSDLPAGAPRNESAEIPCAGSVACWSAVGSELSAGLEKLRMDGPLCAGVSLVQKNSARAPSRQMTDKLSGVAQWLPFAGGMEVCQTIWRSLDPRWLQRCGLNHVWHDLSDRARAPYWTAASCRR